MGTEPGDAILIHHSPIDKEHSRGMNPPQSRLFHAGREMAKHITSHLCAWCYPQNDPRTVQKQPLAIQMASVVGAVAIEESHLGVCVCVSFC